MKNLLNNRLLSLDFFRGLTMLLLIAEFTGLYHYFRSPDLEGAFVYTLAQQLKHPSWDEGMTFWDTIHPFFIFIVGVSMPFSFSKRMKQGGTQNRITLHVFKRSFLLILIGWLIVCISNGKIVLSFLDVLCAIGFSYPIAYFMMRFNPRTQLIFSFGLILITELLYRCFPISGYNQAFVAGQNFGYWVDVVTNQTNSGYWSFFNKVPTTAHIIWGVLIGQLLLSDASKMKKVKIMLICGVVGLVLGYALSPFTPMIKRIATSTWILASAGLAIVVFALCYWAIDVKKYIRNVRFFTVVGMNSLFIYVFVSIGGSRFIRKIVDTFTKSIFEDLSELSVNIISAIVVLGLLWYLCFWLYKKKLFFKV